MHTHLHANQLNKGFIEMDNDYEFITSNGAKNENLYSYSYMYYTSYIHSFYVAIVI